MFIGRQFFFSALAQRMFAGLLATRSSPPPSFNSTPALTDPANSGKVIPLAFGEEGK